MLVLRLLKQWWWRCCMTTTTVLICKTDFYLFLWAVDSGAAPLKSLLIENGLRAAVGIGWCGQVKIMPLMDRAATWSGLRETIIHFLTAGGQKGRILRRQHIMGIRVKICSIIDKNKLLLMHLEKKFSVVLFHVQDDILLTKIHICTVANPTKKSCQISPEGDNPNWNQNEGRKLRVRYQQNFEEGKWKKKLLSRWNEYLVICISYENHNLTIQFTTVFFQKSSRGKIPFNCSGFLWVSKTHNKQIDNRAKLYD